MYKIGLTGGIGSGKSTVLQWFKQKGIAFVDADLVAREVVAPDSFVLQEIINTFGDKIVDDDGHLNRQALADLVFNDEKKLKTLNYIMHSAIYEQIKNESKSFEAQHIPAVIYDIPLLIEAGWCNFVDEIWLVYTPLPTRVARIMHRNSCTSDEAMQRINSQMNLDEKKVYADYIIDNSGTIDTLYKELEKLWNIKSAILKGEDY